MGFGFGLAPPVPLGARRARRTRGAAGGDPGPACALTSPRLAPLRAGGPGECGGTGGNGGNGPARAPCVSRPFVPSRAGWQVTAAGRCPVPAGGAWYRLGARWVARAKGTERGAEGDARCALRAVLGTQSGDA